MKQPIFLYISLIFLLLSAHVYSDQLPPTETKYGDYFVHHMIFPSVLLQPDIAKLHGLKRSKRESLINISVTKKTAVNENKYGIQSTVTGTVKNLMQQQKLLKFIEVKDGKSTYYLAPIRVSSGEVLHIDVNVKPNESSASIPVKFSQKLYPG